ncbi:MAG: formylmethanofuran dehydrogenase subunit E family protein [Candidatus Bathyarchaeota archaeon]|nr:formylmethanofuran dehydrogenase subunit E family protein [Candidatus Bathyarchaeota archaeon]
MKAIKSKISSELASLIKKAAGFHGHLGPFLVIGVRMGSLAKKILNVNAGESNKFRVTARLPLLTPFSCIIDGIQASTQCTVGNQKLRIENSQAKIIVCFEQQNLDKGLRIHVNPKIIKELKDRYSEGASNEELAREIASIPESQLFVIEKQ